MKTHHTYTIHFDNKEQENALVAFMKALKMKFEVSKNDSPYNPDFVEKIKQSQKEISEGKGVRLSKSDLNNLWK